ncbi:MAG: EndoU domain-containing protein [Lachnospiraceae bacterium]|nr:EndoU domain-containing protein [Lachnospiraceae bacterium]
MDSTNNGTEEYQNYRALVISGFEEIENYADQLDESNSEEVLSKIEDTVTYEQPYIGLADDLPFSNVAVDEVKEEKFVAERSAAAYAPENTEYSQADLELTNDAVINDEIRTEFADYATTLEVYQYIKNNYMPEFYYGSRKGSVGAFEERAGNDYDLSSLLIAVLRDRNIPACYVRGNIEITAEQAIQWTGAEDINSAARIIAALGIPVTTLTSENGIVAVRLEHVWVEAYVPYTDYRGAGNNAGDSLWIPLDVSYKKMQHYDGIDLSSLNNYLNDENNFLTSVSTINGVSVENLALLVDGQESAFVKYLLENGYGKSSQAEIYGGKDIVYEYLGYLPLTLPYSVSEKIDSFDDIPLELTDSVSFSLYGNSVYELEFSGTPAINQTFYTPDLYGKRIVLAYTPATDSDRNILNQYGNIFSTPAYLLKLKPQLIVDGEVVAEGSICNAGYKQKYKIKIHNGVPQKSDSTVENSVVVGGMYCIAMDYGTISATSLKKSQEHLSSIDNTLINVDAYTDQVMGEVLDAVAKTYFVQLDIYNSIVAGQNNVCSTRDLSVGIVGFGVNVVYTFNRPSELNEGGIFLDIGHDIHSVVSYDNNADNEKFYMLQTGVYASAMEHGVLEQVTGIESISTIKVLQYAVDNDIPIHSITNDNISTELDMLEISDQVKKEIRTAINTGKMVIIPGQESTINQWTGIGYMVLDTDTYSCGYMISGGLAGGMMSVEEVLYNFCYNSIIGLGNMLILFELSLVPGMQLPIIILGIFFAANAIYSIVNHYMNYLKSGNIREFQESMIELALFCSLFYFGSKIADSLKEPEIVTRARLEAARASENSACFIAGTLISTPNGFVPIEDIEAGDTVWSFDQTTLEVSEKTVEKTFVRQNGNLIKVTAGNETFTATSNHPFYVASKGFVEAIDLRAGDVLITVNGERLVVNKVQHEILESPIDVFNFTVSENHTYFIGSSAVGVHNNNSCAVDPPAQKYEPTQELKNHLNTGNGTYSKNNGINGAHNQTEFLNQLNQHGGNVKSSTTVMEGIIEYTYELPRQDGSGIMYNKTYTKTTYDPSIISDQAFVDMAMEAFSSKQPFGNGYIGTDSSGLTWQIYTDSAGNPTTIYPFIPNGD